MKKLLFLLLFIPLVSFGQDYGNSADAIKLCTVIQTNNFGTDAEAERGLDRILSVIGASKRFVLQPCDNINNAVATSYKGIRYILYDKDFMDSLDSGDNWSNLFILAHEVGHHINGHSLDILLYAAEAVEPETLANKRQQELEADEFAGFILGKLGATLKQTSSSINLISSEKDDTFETHPSKSKRLASIEIGYNKALGNETVVYETTISSRIGEEYFYKAYEQALQNKHKLAILNYDKAINLNYKKDLSYYNKGLSKFRQGDIYDAIGDYNNALKEIKKLDLKIPDYIFFAKGVAKNALGDIKGALNDHTKAVNINPSAKNYAFRGSAKLSLSFETELKDYYGAIADFTETIKLDDDYQDLAYFSRGLAKYYLGDKNGACQDANKAQSLGYNASALINAACN